MSVRTRVYEVAPHTTGLQVMVEDYADGSQTVALRYPRWETSWGEKHRPKIDDDGDHIRTSDDFAQRLADATRHLDDLAGEGEG